MSALALSRGRSEDDFGQPIHHTTGEVLYDAKTVHGPWALMTESSWKRNRASSRLGVGMGQKYRLQADGRWLKVEG